MWSRMPMSEDDEVFIERSFQRTMIVGCFLSNADGCRSWRNSSRTRQLLLPFGDARARYVMPIPSFAPCQGRIVESCMARRTTFTICLTSRREWSVARLGCD